jgi:hypothetical protein
MAVDAFESSSGPSEDLLRYENAQAGQQMKNMDFPSTFIDVPIPLTRRRQPIPERYLFLGDFVIKQMHVSSDTLHELRPKFINLS